MDWLLWGLRLNGGIEGLEIGCCYSSDRIAERCCALFLEYFLPAQVCCFAGFGLSDGIGIAMSSLLGHG